MMATRPFLVMMEALGCRPVRCHGCGDEIVEGDVLTSHRAGGLFVHQRCVSGPITLPVVEEIKKRWLAAMEPIGGIMEAMKRASAGTWESPVATPGPPITWADYQQVVGGNT